MEPKTQAKVTTEKIVLKEILRWLDTNSCTTKYCKPEYAYSVLLYLLIYILQYTTDVHITYVISTILTYNYSKVDLTNSILLFLYISFQTYQRSNHSENCLHSQSTCSSYSDSDEIHVYMTTTEVQQPINND